MSLIGIIASASAPPPTSPVAGYKAWYDASDTATITVSGNAVTQWNDREVFTVVFAPVKDIPKFRALILRVPLTKLIAMTEEAFFGTSLFFVTTTAAQAGIILVLFDRIEKSDRLKFIATGIVAFFLLNLTFVDAFLDTADRELGADLVHKPIAISHRFWEIVTRIHMQKRKRKFRWVKGLSGQPGHHNRVFSTGEKQRRLLKLSGCFPKDVDRFAFEKL